MAWFVSNSLLEFLRSLLLMDVGDVRTKRRKHQQLQSRKTNRKELPVAKIFFLVFQVEEIKRIGINGGKFPSTWEKQ